MASAPSRTPAHLTQANVIGIVNAASGPRDVVVCAAGGMPGDLLKLWRPVDPKGYHLEYGYSTMGYEIAGGLGVKMADPSREVYVMVGDGSYLMLHTEIVTSLEEGMKLTIVVVDNGGFQIIRKLQMSTGSPSFGNELRFRNPETGELDGPYIPIDFAANAASLGAVAMRATNESELREALERAKSETRTVVIHVPVQKHASVPGFDSWWDVPVAEVSEVANRARGARGVRRAGEERAVLLLTGGRTKQRAGPLGVGADRDPAVLHPNLVGRDRHHGRAVDQRAVVKTEDRAVPRTGDGIPFDRSLVQRTAKMGAGRPDRPDPVALPQQEHRRAIRFDAVRRAVRKIVQGGDVGPVRRRLLERGVVDADPELVGKLAPKPGRGQVHAETKRGEGDPGPAPPLLPQQPGAGHETGGGDVQQSVEGAKTARCFLVGRVLPLGGAGHRGPGRAHEAQPQSQIRRALFSHQVEEHRR